MNGNWLGFRDVLEILKAFEEVLHDLLFADFYLSLQKWLCPLVNIQSKDLGDPHGLDGYGTYLPTCSSTTVVLQNPEFKIFGFDSNFANFQELYVKDFFWLAIG